MTKAQSKVGDLERKREAKALVKAVSQESDLLAAKLDHLLTGFTPSARASILNSVSEEQGVKAASVDAISQVYGSLWPPKKAKNNGEYLGALFSAVASLAGTEDASVSFVSDSLFKVLQDVSSDNGSVIARDQLQSIATSFTGGHAYLLDILKKFSTLTDGCQQISGLWAHMITPFVGVKSAEDCFREDIAAQMLESSLAIPKWMLSEEHLLLLPRLAYLGGTESEQLARKAPHTKWSFGNTSRDDASTAAEQPITNQPEGLKPLLPSQKALLAQIEAEIVRLNEENSKLQTELAEAQSRCTAANMEMSNLKSNLHSLELASDRQASRHKENIKSLNASIAKFEDELSSARLRESELNTEIDRVMHQSGTLSELKDEKIEQKIDEVFLRPLQKLNKIVDAAAQKNPDVGEFKAVQAQLSNCLRKSGQYIRSLKSGEELSHSEGTGRDE